MIETELKFIILFLQRTKENIEGFFCSFKKSFLEFSRVAYICHSSTQEAEVGGL
jgi:hypothetical protein